MHKITSESRLFVTFLLFFGRNFVTYILSPHFSRVMQASRILIFAKPNHSRFNASWPASLVVPSKAIKFSNSLRLFSNATNANEKLPQENYNTGRRQNESLAAYAKKLEYRSKLRGTKENILLLGTFATKHLSTFDEAKLKQFEQILEEADPDVYNWVVVSLPLPNFKNIIRNRIILI